MYKGKRIGVVVPAYNEEGFVGDVIESVPPFVDRIYPVDDCSTDATWDEIRQAATNVNSEPPVLRADGGGEDVRVVPLRHDHNRGVGAAIKTGYCRAADDDLEVVAVMNGDGQMDPDVLDRILNPVVEGVADYAKGNRLLTADYWEGMSGWRLFGNFLLTYLTRIATGYWRMADSQNGYTAISVDLIRSLNLEEVYDGYGFLNDLLVRLNVQNARIADVEMRAVYGEETSSIRYPEFIPRLSWLLLRGFLWRLYMDSRDDEFHPGVFPYALGIVSTGALLFLLPLTFVKSGGAGSQISVGIVSICCLLLVSLGMLFDRHQNRGLETTIRERG